MTPPGGVVLLYHRVGDPAVDPWGLNVTPQRFATHVQFLRQCMSPVSLSAFYEDTAVHLPNKRAVAVTFDDGYVSSLENTHEALEKFEVPATCFVPTGWVGSDTEFWWDELERIVLGPQGLPDLLEVVIGDEALSWRDRRSPASRGFAHADRSWRAWHGRHPSARHELYARLWELCLPLDPQTRENAIKLLRDWAACGSVARGSHRVATAAEVRTFAGGSLFAFGAHTVTHPLLAGLSESAQRQEIAGSRLSLEDVLGRSVTAFAYPFGKRGDYSEQTVALVRASGYTCACANFPGLVTRGTDVYQLPRLFVEDWDADELSRRIAGLQG